MYHNIYRSTTCTPHHHLPSSIVEHSSVHLDGLGVCAYGPVKGAIRCTASISLYLDIFQYLVLFLGILIEYVRVFDLAGGAPA